MDEEILTTPEARQTMYDSLDAEFRERSRDVAAFLNDSYGRTRDEYSGAFEAHKEGKLDILSSESPITSGVIAYQKLLPSRAYAVTATEDVIDALLRFGQVERIHPNYVYEIPDIEMDNLSAGSSSVGGQAWHRNHIGVDVAQQRSKGKTVKVAVLDSGLDPLHPEFSSVTIAGHAEWDTLGRVRSNATLRDTHIHGTHVAGILCGDNVGVAPEIDLYIGIIAPQGQASFAQINAGLDWAAQNNVDIISLSVGKPGYHNYFETANVFAHGLNILVVAAIGNNGPGTHRSPGDYQAVLSVGATDANDQAWVSSTISGQASAGGMITVGSSSYRKPDIYAPGADIYSCIPQNGYRTMSGTSMATPAVVGVIALVKSLKPSLSAKNLRQHILQNCSLGGNGWRVSASKAV
jgi:subtilisin family serine protease